MWTLLAACTTPRDSDAPPDTEVVDTAPPDDTAPLAGWQPPACAATPCATLSEWGLYADLAAGTPADGVVPYEVNAPLWSDGAGKDRLIALPGGAHATWTADGPWELPVGAVLVKTFALPERLETRLLVHEPGGWVGRVYRWTGADAAWAPDGETVDLGDGAYVVPPEADCASCHTRAFATAPIGPSAVQLVRGTQIDALVAAGVLGSAPDTSGVVPLADPADDAAPVEARARAWLHANCAHCHSASGPSGFSGFWLSSDVTDPAHLGVCKPPLQGDAGTGLAFDVVPGHPELSFLAARVASTDPAVKMPEGPALRPDPLGVALVNQWIAEMPEDPCSSN